MYPNHNPHITWTDVSDNFTGLSYRQVGKMVVEKHKINGDLSSVYFQAILASHNVDQHDLVNIYWMGQWKGMIKGQA